MIKRHTNNANSGERAIDHREQSEAEMFAFALQSARAKIAAHELRKQNAVLKNQAFFDPLTGLYNRRFFGEKFQSVLRAARAGRMEEQTISLFIVDVDNFKKYNDEYGHLVGDEALKDVAKGLSSAVREGDLVARTGGDEFSLLIVDGHPDHIKTIAQRIKNLQGKPITFGGICLYGHEIHQNNYDDKKLTSFADGLLYLGKGKGRNHGVLQIGQDSFKPIFMRPEEGVVSPGAQFALQLSS